MMRKYSNLTIGAWERYLVDIAFVARGLQILLRLFRRAVRQSEYQKRAGDIPEFLEKIDEAKEKQRLKVFDNSMKMLFDMY